MNGVRDRLVKGGIWLSIARVIVNGLTTLSTFVMAWYLTPSDFGLVAIAMTLLLIVNAATEMSLGQALIRHEDPGRPHFDAAWTLGLIRGLLIGGLFAAAAWPVAAIYEDPRLIGIMLALSVSLLLTGLVNPLRFMLQRDLIFHKEFVITVSQKLAGFVVMLVVAVVWQSYWALVLGNVANQLVNVILSYVVRPYRPRFNFNHMRELLSFSVWLTLGQIINTLNWRFEYLLIGKLLGAAPLGIYTMGNQLSQLPTRETTTPLNQAIYPGFSRVAQDPARLRGAYQRAQALVTAIALPAGVGVAVVADPLVRLVLGEKWLEVVPIVQVLAAIFALQTLGSLVQPLGMTLNQTRRLFIRDLVMFAVRVPIILVSLLVWSLPGVVAARVVTGLLATAVNMTLVRRLIDLPLRRQLHANLRALVAVALMAAGVRGLAALQISDAQGMHLAMQLGGQILTGLAIYLGVTAALWRAMGRPEGPEREAVRLLPKLIAKIRRKTSAPGSS